MQELIRRADARAAGLNRYFTGKPCPHGHIVERIVSSGACLTCAREKKARWKSDNQEKEHARQVQWVKDNPEKIKASSAKWRIKNAAARAEKQRIYRAKNLEKEMNRQANWLKHNQDKMRAINASWYQENRHKVAARSARRRTSEAQATPAWDAELTDLVLAEAFSLAKQRETSTGIAWHVDHMIPLKASRACGLHVWSNIQVIPERMNLSKHNRMIFTEPGEWIRHLVPDLRPKLIRQKID